MTLNDLIFIIKISTASNAFVYCVMYSTRVKDSFKIMTTTKKKQNLFLYDGIYVTFIQT